MKNSLHLQVARIDAQKGEADTTSVLGQEVRRLGQEVIEEINNITDFRRRVKSYARSDPDNAVSQYWPVVKRIEVSGPFVRLEGIKGDLELSIQLVANGLSAAGSLHFP